MVLPYVAENRTAVAGRPIADQYTAGAFTRAYAAPPATAASGAPTSARVSSSDMALSLGPE